MPELPEVEVTTRNLQKIINLPARIIAFEFYRKDLRNRIPIKALQKMSGSKLVRLYRRAKFIVFEFADANIVSHLGMTGSWRLEKNGWVRRKHDHISLSLSDDRALVYNDPRRFGEFNLYTAAEMCQRFEKFGPEPLHPQTNWDAITAQFKNLKTEIKVCLMNQKYLVGVGNIYASEALFRAGIKPGRKANRVTVREYNELWKQVREVLNEAIAAGGSSIQDFRNGYGESGNFQKQFAVYDRADDQCIICKEKIKMKNFGGRSTFWCSQCQK